MNEFSERNASITRCFVLLFLALLCGCVHSGQAVLKEQKLKLDEIPMRWQSNPSVVLDSLTELRFHEKKSANKVTRKDVLWVYINKRHPNHWEDITYYDFESYEKPLKISATVFYPDGSRWSLSPEQVQRVKINFSNAYENTFSIPKYNQGIIIRLEIRRHYFHPEFISTFVLRHNSPALQRKIELTMPETCRLSYGLENGEEVEVEESTIVENGYRRFSISAKSLPSRLYKWETEFPEQWYAALHVSFPPKGNRSFTWQELGDYYLNLSRDAVKVSSAIKNFGAPISIHPRDGILKDAFAKLIGKVRYHGDWEGRYAFFPRSAETILAHGYGDCKEISTLLHTLLKTKDLKTHLSLVSTWNNYQPIAKYPSLDNFNHMVLAYPVKEEEFHFLDGTNQWANSGNSYYSLVGRTAFVLEPGRSRLIKVHQGGDFKSRILTRIKIAQDSETDRWFMQGRIRLLGYPALHFFSYLNGSASAEKTTLVKRFLIRQFGIHSEQIRFEAQTSNEAVISYRSSFQQNYLDLGDGGFKLNLPRLYDQAVDLQLIEKSGPVFMNAFEQQDAWELPIKPINKGFSSFDLPFASQQWSTNGAIVTRTYQQTTKRFGAEDPQLDKWTQLCKKSGDNLVWK